MALLLDDKKAVVAKVAEIASNSISAIAVDYQGLTANEMVELRSNAREQNVEMQVVRNTLARLAIKDTTFECMNDVLTGPLFLAFSREDPGAPARIIAHFAKEHEAITVRALSVNGKLLPVEQLQAVADLPTFDEAVSKVLFVMKAPITKFVRTLAEPYAQLVRVMAAVSDKKKTA